MKLYLHIGTEKTGSSYLQSIAAVNRDQLLKEGIWFPDAGKRDKQMLKGDISAGNAQKLTDYINKGDLRNVKEILLKWKLETEKRNSHTTLLSNELLVLSFAKENRLNRFLSVVKEVGFTEVFFFLMLRDPLDQALSLYKHRAKNGTTPEIENWPHENYHYGELSKFFNLASDLNIDLITRKYSKEKGVLVKSFFKDWLDVKSDLRIPFKEVNPSLTLSELLLIKRLKSKHDFLTKELYSRFLEIKKKEKAKEPRLEKYYKHTLQTYLTQFETTWKLCNQFLLENEQLEIPNKPDQQIDIEEKVVTLSSKQSEELVKLMGDELTNSFRLSLFIQNLKNKLGKLKNRVLVKINGTKQTK